MKQALNNQKPRPQSEHVVAVKRPMSAVTTKTTAHKQLQQVQKSPHRLDGTDLEGTMINRIQLNMQQQILKQQGHNNKLPSMSATNNENTQMVSKKNNNKRHKDQSAAALQSSSNVQNQTRQNQLDKLLAHASNQQSNQYRVAQSHIQHINISDKFWNDSNKLQGNTSIGAFHKSRPQSSIDVQRELFSAKVQSNPLLAEYEQPEQLEALADQYNQKANYHRTLYQHQKPFNFLSKLGGKAHTMIDIEQQEDLNLNPQIELLNTHTPSNQQMGEYQQHQQQAEVKRPIQIKNRITVRDTENQLQEKDKFKQLHQEIQQFESLDIDLNIKQQMNKKAQMKHRQQLKREKRLLQDRPQTAIFLQHTLQTQNTNTNNNSNIAASLRPQTSMATMQLQQQQMQIRQVTAKRPMTATLQPAMKKQRHVSALPELVKDKDKDIQIMEDAYEGNEDFYDQMEGVKGGLKQNQNANQYKRRAQSGMSSNLLKCRPISGKSSATQQFFNNFSKFCSFSEAELPYETLFDTNERTVAACFAKFGDLEFHSPGERIGQYCQFNSKLKRNHLMELIDMQKTTSHVEREEFEVPIQLAVLDELAVSDSRSLKIGIATPFHPDNIKRIPISLSLYPEYIDEGAFSSNRNGSNQAQLSPYQLAQQQFQLLLSEMGNIYDPILLGISNYIYINPSSWPDNIKKQVATSLTRFEHYIQSDIIQKNEIAPFNKNWIVNACCLIPEILLQVFDGKARQLIHEICLAYLKSQKEAMLQYVLLCPQERKRLHIELLPRAVLCSASRIAREGGYNLQLYPQWHQHVQTAKNQLNANLTMCNIVNSALTDWFVDFSHFRLCETQNMRLLGIKGQSLTLQSFVKLQTAYQNNTLAIMKNVWYKGTLLIIKRFKYLRKKHDKIGKWTYNGFKVSQNSNMDNKTYSTQQQTSNTNRVPTTESSEEEEEASSVNSEMKDNHLNVTEYEDKAERLYCNLVHNSLDEECAFYTTSLDSLNGLQISDLKDIRENAAYKIYMLLSNQVIQFEENGWKLLPKTLRTRIQECTAVLLGLQLRQTVKATVQQLEQLFLSIPSRSLLKQAAKQEAESMESADSNKQQLQSQEIVGQKNKQQKQMNKQMMRLQYMTKEEKGKFFYEKQVRAIDESISVDAQREKEQQERSVLEKEQSRHLTFSQLSSQNQNQNQQVPSESVQEQNPTVVKAKKATVRVIQTGKGKSEFLQSVADQDTLQLSIPPFLQEQRKEKTQFFPFLRLQVAIQKRQLVFKENEEFIQTELRRFFRSLVRSFEDFPHPTCLSVETLDKQQFADYLAKQSLEKQRLHQAKAGGASANGKGEKGGKEGKKQSKLLIGDGETVSPIKKSKKPQAQQQQKQKNKKVESLLPFSGDNTFLQLNYQNILMDFAGFVHINEKTLTKKKQQSVIAKDESQSEELQSKKGENDDNDDNEKDKKDMLAMLNSGHRVLTVASEDEEEFSTAYKRMSTHIIALYHECSDAFQIFSQFALFINKQAEKEVQQLIAQSGKSIPLQDFRLYIEALNKYQALLHKLPSRLQFPLFEVSNEKVKELLFDKISSLKHDLMARFQSNLQEAMQGVYDKYNGIIQYVRKSTKDADEVEAMERYIYELSSEQILIKQQSSECFNHLLFLNKLDIPISEKLKSICKDLYQCPDALSKELVASEKMHLMEKSKLEEDLREAKKQFEIASLEFTNRIKELELFTEYNKYKNYNEILQKHQLELKAKEDGMHKINDQEKKLLGYTSNFESFQKLQDFLNPHLELWSALESFVEDRKRWMNSSLASLDVGEVEQQAKATSRVVQRLLKTFEPSSLTYRVVTELKEDMAQIQKVTPCIEVLSNPGLKERHWADIQQKMNVVFNYKEGTLKEILAKGVESHFKDIEGISEVASKEYKLECMLDKMEAEWAPLTLQVVQWKQSELSILQGQCVEDLQQLLDEHTIRAQTIRANPDVKFMEQRAVQWETMMLHIQDILEAWVGVQQMLLYLEPIFSFQDISSTLETESRQFTQVQNSWKSVLFQVSQDPAVLHLVNIPGLLDMLIHSQKLIEQIQKGLERHLETKRLEFPRFFFLSNEDLINILAETKDPYLVQPHIKKCFEGIQSLIFSENAEIQGMRSAEKEEVMFVQEVVPREFASFVEKWLNKVEYQMREALIRSIKDSLLDLAQILEMGDSSARGEWAKRCPGQVILAVAGIQWTSSVQNILSLSNANNNKSNTIVSEYQGIVSQCTDLNSYLQELTEQLNNVVKLVRGQLSSLERQAMGALIVNEVHWKDIVEEMLVKQVQEADAFEWVAQMRYYFSFDTEMLSISMLSTTIKYGYEYLGASSRLVITPLTDRCYRTLMSALKLNLGGAPEGPAGTGKTESTKDLAKALAMQCVVFNCSEGLNIHSMAKFFKGLAASGAWSCFDEFNRIDVEVLSVIAQQILTIQQAKAKAEGQLTHFDFEGVTGLALRQNCNIFITMNPGYAGRTELPDNLKALFRPCAMMVPDYALIAEISLYSFGFINARQLAKKVVATYKLCSEQLSTQPHYDYGMRAVKAVLTSAANLKRRYALQQEDEVVLRSLQEVNLPKFLSADLTLFEGIISDLFPKLTPISPEYSILNQGLTQALSDANLQNIASLRKKVIQLFEMTFCRHGIMLVGETLSAKTTCYQVLCQSLNNAVKILKDPIYANQPSNDSVMKAHYYVINPKAISMKQMYGYSDPVSKEWTEGVLAEIFRKLSCLTTQERQFMVFDGPVSADWIENMNTVLDDNKKLCLMNAETIAMTDYMTMMFEVNDLNQASPATVSRCGMIYFQPDQIGWQPVYQSWLATLSNNTFKIAAQEDYILMHIDDLFDAITNKCLDFILHKTQMHQPLPGNALVIMQMRLFQSLILQYKLNSAKEMQSQNFIQKINMVFIMSVVWGLAGGLQEQSRKTFSVFFRRLLGDAIKCDSKKDKLVRFEKAMLPPEKGGVPIYDYMIYIDQQQQQAPQPNYVNSNEDSSAANQGLPLNLVWKQWKDITPLLFSTLEQVQQVEHFHDILVPTSESLCLQYMLQCAINNQYPLLSIGHSGTGKTVYFNSYLKNKGLMHNKIVLSVCFSAQTTASKTQQIVDGRLERRRKGVYGPPGFQTQGVLFVDDLNMPMYDKYGAQPPLELLRQLLSQKGWYGQDRKFMTIVDTTLIAAMGPPQGGGRNPITPRLLRHFHLLSLAENDERDLQNIFSTLMRWHFMKKHADLSYNNFNGLQGQFGIAVDAAITIYLEIKDKLKPTPNKIHYLFNLRHLSRVVQGLQLYNITSKVESLLNIDTVTCGNNKVTRLLLHEVARVFYDCLCDEEDQKWLYKVVQQSVRSKMKDDIKMVLKGTYPSTMVDDNSHYVLQKIKFADVLGDELLAGDRQYTEVLPNNHVQLYSKLDQFLEDLNTTSKKPLHLVLFEFAVHHILILLRVMRMDKGHALLIGLGGSGRKSLTRLAAFIEDYEVVEVEMPQSYSVDQWKQDMQTTMGLAGADCKNVVLLISESQLSKGFVPEDINNLINTGDIPNLFTQEEFVPNIEKLRKIAKKYNKQDLLESGQHSQFYDFFVENVQKQLHLILVMSPIGKELRQRIRMFPSLVNCSTVVWFSQWPDSALHAVADSTLEQIDFNSLNSTKGNVAQLCVEIHTDMHRMSEQYRQTEQRVTYVTPSHYMELMKYLVAKVEQKKSKLQMQRQMYIKGVEKLQMTAEQVKQMEEELVLKKPILETMQIESQELALQIQKEVQLMEPLREQAQIEEAFVKEKFQQAELISNECQDDLSKAKPKLVAAEKALQVLDENDITNLKSMQKPPDTVRMVMEAVCVLKKVQPEIKSDPKNPKEKIVNYWDNAKKMLSEKDFLKSLIEYDKQNIPEQMMRTIREKYISKTKDFNPQRVERASSAARGMCEWILALDDFEKVLRYVRPKQEKYNLAKAECMELNKRLQEKQANLKLLADKIEELEKKHNETLLKQQKLQEDIEDCQKRIHRATLLTSGLGGEQERWLAQAAQLGNDLQDVLGDVILACGCLSYLGPFDQTYRTLQIEHWKCLLGSPQYNIQFSGDRFALHRCLLAGGDVDLQNWINNGLPADAFSAQNGVMCYQSERWPLVIDPQCQANRWIRSTEHQTALTSQTQSQFKVTKQGDSDFGRQLENAISFGYVLLIENLLEEVDAVLDPVLTKATFKNLGVLSIKLGDNIVQYSKHFRLFLTTKLRNPSYSPETQTKVNLINFTLTDQGLTAQLVERAISNERPDLNTLNKKLIIQDHENKLQLMQIERQILELLSQEGNILDDENAVDVLQNSKKVSNEIYVKQRDAEQNKKKIEKVRVSLLPVAVHASKLFFAVMALGKMEYMYQYSLQWFITIFSASFVEIKDGQQQQQYQNQNELAESPTRHKKGVSTEQVTIIQDRLTTAIFSNVCRGLFEKDKLLFTFIILTQLHLSKIDPREFNFLVSPINTGGSQQKPMRKPPTSQISSEQFVKAVALSQSCTYFSDLPASLCDYPSEWQSALSSQASLSQCLQSGSQPNAQIVRQSQQMNKNSLPAPYNSNNESNAMTDMQKLCLLKALCPEYAIAQLKTYIENALGKKYIQEPVTFDIEKSYLESTNTSPLLFLLPGTDPLQILLSFSKSKSIELRTISLGQGQGVLAQKMIEKAMLDGAWVLLQNCHLAPSWMPQLDALCNIIELDSTNIHRNFRLWLSSYPSVTFPVAILQNAIKMTNEPPAGLISNLLVSYNSDTLKDDEFYSQPNPSMQKCFSKLLFGLTFFHALIQERRSFGPLGWNLYYDFNQSDLSISARQLLAFMKNNSEKLASHKMREKAVKLMIQECIPFKTMHYLVAECNYGGRVTDDMDRRILTALMLDCFDTQIVQSLFHDHSSLHSNFNQNQNQMQQFNFLDVNGYQLPDDTVISHQDHLQFISNKLPKGQPPPGLYGFHSNAEITRDINNTNRICSSLLVCYGLMPLESAKSNNLSSKEQQMEQQDQNQTDKMDAQAQTTSPTPTVSSQEEILKGMANEMLGRMPKLFDLEMVKIKYPLTYQNSMNTVLHQEVQKFNLLNKTITQSLKDLLLVLQGLLLTSQTIDDMILSLQMKQVPQLWKKFSYPSMKPLAQYLDDLLQRLDFYSVWILQTPPSVFWISGFFFTQSFLTAILQNYARKYTVAIDHLTFAFEFVKEEAITKQPRVEINSFFTAKDKPKNGCYIHGLFFEGARWDFSKSQLEESEMKVLYTAAPIMLFVPTELNMQQQTQQQEAPSLILPAYNCPVYKTTERKGVLTTTGHSTNYIMSIQLPTSQHHNHWVKRGVALLCQLSE